MFKKDLFQNFFRLTLPFLVTICCVRLYEYFSIASKLFIDKPYRFEIAGLLYDIWLWFLYCVVIFILYFLFFLINKRVASVAIHLLNIFLIISYLGLIIVFSERNTPFDHEFFTRSLNESVETSKQMLSSSFSVYIPFAAYLLLYFACFRFFSKKNFSRPIVVSFGVLTFLSVCFVGYSNPSPGWFKKISGYYLTCNKLTYWVVDSYHFFQTKDQFNHPLSNEQLAREVDFYQKNQPFQFVSKEYPLLHENNDNDVLGRFFNFNKTPPNIVILVVEGLSADFSGDGAYAGSFTPFLDSLARQGLSWHNFLSTAPGTFAAHPAISGSLPYGKKGFSIMNVMPDHLSLIKILKQNGYWTNFMIGFNPDFDNLGGYVRLQGTDFILTRYPSKYKEMGVGEEGWSMGYPDDALFSRSFEVMDSLKKTNPYLTIYHTATTHMPYLFEQKPLYEKLFDKKLASMKVSSDIKATLKATKKVITTFMFSDDCIRKFFSDYSKRPEYNNTIFFITGDHHIGSFPITGEIDDFHVPFIVYSAMLKHPQKFLSVNSHANITPTILSMLFGNFNLPDKPKQVHWLGDVLDTATAFRNIHSMPFMKWSRDIDDYICKDYFLSGNQLYKLTPDLIQEPYDNDSVKNYMIRLRENFKIINAYVCDNNKIYPNHDLLPGDKELLEDHNDPKEKLIYDMSSDTTLMKHFKIPGGYKYLYVEATAKVNMPASYLDVHPQLQMALVDLSERNKDYLYDFKREMYTLSKSDWAVQQWNNISTHDMITLEDFKKAKNLNFELGIWTDSLPINFKIQNLDVKIYGIKDK